MIISERFIMNSVSRIHNVIKLIFKTCINNHTTFDPMRSQINVIPTKIKGFPYYYCRLKSRKFSKNSLRLRFPIHSLFITYFITVVSDRTINGNFNRRVLNQ